MNITAPPPGFTLVQADAVIPQPWRNGGGQTRELLAWPEGQDWKLRISRADIAADGPFSAFAGIDRWFTVLEGAGVALHFSALHSAGTPAKTVTLRLGDAPLYFDGALAPGCSLLNGATQDLNLMARAGRSTMQRVETNAPWSPSFAINGIYTAARGTWSGASAFCVSLPAHSLLWCHSSPWTADSPQVEADNHMRWTFTPDTPDAPNTRAWWLGYSPDAP